MGANRDLRRTFDARDQPSRDQQRTEHRPKTPTSKDTSRAWASPNPQHPHQHTTHPHHPSPSAHNGRKTKARCNSSALSCNNDKGNLFSFFFFKNIFHSHQLFFSFVSLVVHVRKFQ